MLLKYFSDMLIQKCTNLKIPTLSDLLVLMTSPLNLTQFSNNQYILGKKEKRTKDEHKSQSYFLSKVLNLISGV